MNLCVLTIAAIIAGWKAAAVKGFVLLAADLIVLAVRNRCQFCRKMLRIGLMDGVEYCSYCGSEIK